MMADTDQETIDNLVESLDEVDVETRKKAARTLASIGKAAVPALIKGLQSPTRRRCWESAKVLMEIDDPRWIEPMVEALKSPNVMLGQIALQALGDKVKESPQILLPALLEAHRMLQPHLIRELVKHNIQEAIPTIITLLKETESSIVRFTLIEALTEFAVIDALELILTFADDYDAHVRNRVATAIQKLGTPANSAD